MKKVDWFDLIVKRLSRNTGLDVWSDGREILCGDVEAANGIAGLIESLYFAQDEGVMMYTGYYDPEDDAESHEEHPHWGWWFVRVLCK